MFGSNNAPSADNQQETLYYFSGFMVGECSVSLIRASNRRGGSGYYITPDITISNSDLMLLTAVNRVVAHDVGVITRIKGGFNLSFRGKKKVQVILSFFGGHPPLRGDMIQEKLLIMREAIDILLQKNHRNVRLPDEETKIETLRNRLKDLKREGKSEMHFSLQSASRKEIGYFLAGIVDAEGSMGFKKSGDRLQPYFCVAMREEEIINLFQEHFGFGSKYYRPPQKLFQFETGKRENVVSLCEYFLDECPVHLLKNRVRMQKVIAAPQRLHAKGPALAGS